MGSVVDFVGRGVFQKRRVYGSGKGGGLISVSVMRRERGEMPGRAHDNATNIAVE